MFHCKRNQIFKKTLLIEQNRKQNHLKTDDLFVNNPSLWLKSSQQTINKALV